MRVVMFYHSAISDWNHGNAHMLRGVARELVRLGHEVSVYEPRDAWSVVQLRAERGDEPIGRFRSLFPWLDSRRYTLEVLDLDRALAGADLVIVHEWNDPELVRRIGEHRGRVGGTVSSSTIRITARSRRPQRWRATISVSTTGCWHSARRSATSI